jgi:O-succinylbenzoic acid--CoA ligase
MTTLSLFDAAREAPQAPALIEGERTLSFDELAARAEPFARTLARERPAALQLTPRADVPSLLWLYAAFATATPVLTLHTRATAAEISQVSALIDAVPPNPNWPVPTHEASSLAAGDRDCSAPHDAEAPLVFIPTSGSTGEPRLVELSRRAVVASAEASAANLGWQADDRWLLCLPLAHTGGLSIVLRCLLARKPVVLFDAGTEGALARIAELARSIERASLVSLVPSLLDALLDAGFRGHPGLRAVLLGGAACSPALARRAHAAGIPLLTSYGLTETASQVVTRRYAERLEPLAEHAGCVSAGHAVPGVEVALEGGLIAVRTPSLFSRYVGASPREPAAADEPARRAGGWLVTSDRGAFGSSGELYVLGRADDLIVTAAEKVDPIEVENALLELPDVRGACVFGTISERFGHVITAAIVTSDAALTDPETLGRLLAHRLARHKWPRRVLRVDSLPLTPSGKLDRRQCQARWADSFER